MLHFRKYGEGDRVIVGFHGWGSEHTKSFRDLVPHLPEDVAFYAMDLPGCGESPGLKEWSWEGVLDELALLLDTIEPQKQVTLLGSCSGSFQALGVLERRPERVRDLVLLEPFAFIPWFFSIFLVPVTGKLLYKMVFDNPIGRKMTEASMKKQGVSDDFDMVGSFAKGSDLNVAYRYLQYYGDLNSYAAYQDAPDRPVHIVHGEKSWKAIRQSPDLWRKLWPDLSVTVLKDAGHMFSQEIPERAAQAMFAKVTRATPELTGKVAYG